MHIILGATGHVGSALLQKILAHGEPVTAITHSPDKAEGLRALGAGVAVADVFDTASLHRVFAAAPGARLYLLSPPAAPATDTDLVERRSVTSIVEAVRGASPAKVVVHSTSGAQPVERAGDLGVLYALEQGIKALPAPVSVLRAGYYFSNWDASLATAREEGVLHTMFPGDFKLPMVAPQDLGEVGARLMLQAPGQTGVLEVEGPERYSSNDVAAAFAKALGRPVKAVTTPPDQWQKAFEAMGFSAAAAASYARMTQITLDEKYEMEGTLVRGKTTLQEYVAALVAKSP